MEKICKKCRIMFLAKLSKKKCLLKLSSRVSEQLKKGKLGNGCCSRKDLNPVLQTGDKIVDRIWDKSYPLHSPLLLPLLPLKNISFYIRFDLVLCRCHDKTIFKSSQKSSLFCPTCVADAPSGEVSS